MHWVCLYKGLTVMLLIAIYTFIHVALHIANEPHHLEVYPIL